MRWQISLLAASLAFSPGILSANVATINLSSITGVTITGYRAPKGGKISGASTSYAGTNPVTASVSGSKTDANGDATISNPGFSSTVGAQGTVTIGGDHWSGLQPNHAIYRDVPSDEESKPTKGFIFSPSDFQHSYDSLLFFNGVLSYNRITLVNNGLNEYLISSLMLYTGLNLKYFTAATFDSPAAIASGTLYDDAVADVGGPFAVAANGGPLTMSAGLVPNSSYSLLVGTVQEILPGGRLGPFETVALASAVPEPSTLLMLLSGAVVTAGYGLRRLIR